MIRNVKSARLLSVLARGRSGCAAPVAARAMSAAAGKPPSNPFEVDLGALSASAATSEKLSLEDAKRAAATQQAKAQSEINLLHDEMSRLFGEEVAEYGGDTSPSSVEEAVVAVEGQSNTLSDPSSTTPLAAVQREQSVVPQTRAVVKPKQKREKIELTSSSAESKVGEQGLENKPVDVLLLQGPCSFVRGVWTGGDIGRKELQTQVQTLADELEIVVKSCNYDSENIILQMLLEARSNQVIVLCWNISLSHSPFIVHALELIQSRVIIVSPVGVVHGPLPENVVGILSGFWNQSLSLAINAAANVLSFSESNHTKLQEFSDTIRYQKFIGGPNEKKKETPKKKIFTCYLCGKEGHIRRNCPKV